MGFAILTVAILSLISIFPTTLRAHEDAELLALGASLAMMKIEEIRRDNDCAGELIDRIRNLLEPTEPVPFGQEPRLAYRLSSTTILYVKLDSAGDPVDDPADPRDDAGVARVIIQESPLFSSEPKIIAEFRFDAEIRGCP